MLTVFGEVPEDIQRRVKYAKWKAIYISRCLKNGETPVPGPVAGTDAEEFDFPQIPTDNSNTDFEEQKPTVPSNQPSFPANPTVQPSSSPWAPTSDFHASNVAHSTISAMSKKSFLIKEYIIN